MLNLDIQNIRSNEAGPFWCGFSLGISGQWGPQYGFFKGGSLKAIWTPFGELRLLTEEIPTKDRSYRDIASNYFYVFKLGF